MVGGILELITTILKIFLLFAGKYVGWKAEERARFEERMKNITNLLKEAAQDKAESVNEEDYLTNLDWEKKKRYDEYKRNALEILSRGGGFNDLKEVKFLGMNLRVVSKEKEVVEIITKDLKLDDKCKLIAKTLLEI